MNASPCDQRLLDEDKVSLRQAVRLLRMPSGKKVNVAMLTRWCLHGIAGIRLEHLCRDGELYTSRQALTRFLQMRNRGCETYIRI